jgi:hypothetical protein
MNQYIKYNETFNRSRFELKSPKQIVQSVQNSTMLQFSQVLDSLDSSGDEMNQRSFMQMRKDIRSQAKSPKQQGFGS